MYTAARMLKMYACTMPVSRPKAVITKGNNRGVMVNSMAMIIEPLIMLPNNRTASANVRESSLMMLNGNMRSVGSV